VHPRAREKIVSDPTTNLGSLLRGNPELRAKVRASSTREDVLAILAESGITVSVEDIADLEFSDAPSAADGLSDEELQAAVGGRRNVIQHDSGRFGPGI